MNFLRPSLTTQWRIWFIGVIAWVIMLWRLAFGQAPPPTPITVPPVLIKIGSDGSANGGPGGALACGWVIKRMVEPTISATWRDLATGQISPASQIYTRLPRPDLSAIFHLSSADVGWCAVGPSAPGSYQVLVTADDQGSPPVSYTFTVSVGPGGFNPIFHSVNWIGGSVIPSGGSLSLAGTASDVSQAGSADHITAIRIVARDVNHPDQPAFVVASPGIVHFNDPGFPGEATYSATLSLPDGTWDLTAVAVATINGTPYANRQMIRVRVGG